MHILCRNRLGTQIRAVFLILRFIRIFKGIFFRAVFLGGESFFISHWRNTFDKKVATVAKLAERVRQSDRTIFRVQADNFRSS